MKTLYEELLKIDLKLVDPRFQEIFKFLDEAELINTQNVVNYFFQGTTQEHWDLTKDFPNLAPPFQTFFMEYTIPQYILYETGQSENKLSGMRVGILAVSEEYSDEEKSHCKSPNLRWKLNLIIWAKPPGGETKLFPVAIILIVDSLGKLVPVHDENNVVLMPVFFDIPDEELDTWKSMARIYCDPALLAICFMHCKNVQRVEHDPHKKATQKRNRHSCRVKHYTLQIDPMRKILETEGGINENGLKKALHICRGHFKDFSQGKGLFGKYKGVYWWADQTRGSIQNGIVNKDYEVTSPDASTI
jgi:hypothetical protein